MSRDFISTALSPGFLSAFEGPLSAFLGYSAPDTTYAPSTVMHGPEDEQQSQIVIPSRLLLDGSSIVERKPSPMGMGEAYATQEETQPTGSTRPESAVSFASLATRLKRSSSSIRHVHSVLRLSSTNSWRSSMSFLSSVLFSEVQSQSDGAAESVAHDTIPASRTSQEAQSSSQLEIPLLSEQASLAHSHLDCTKGNVFSELETFTLHELARDRYYLRYPSPSQGRYRRCCHHIVTSRFRCRKCGRNSNHLMAWKGQIPLIDNIRDYYGNTSLHFAGGSPAASSTLFINMIKAGADPRSLNTSGETFLHILFSHQNLKTLPLWISFLRYLDKLDFPFSTQDYHGRTIFHLIQNGLKDYDHSPNVVEKVITIMNLTKVSLNVMDNRGLAIYDHLQELLPKKLPLSMATDRFPLPYPSRMIEPTFVASLLNFDYDLVTWVEWLSKTDTYSWIDSSGDTPLLALIKSSPAHENWMLPDDVIDRIVHAGVKIHMRDRNGETALAAAAQRGMRPVVKKLMDLGASIHCRDYLGISVLRHMRTKIRQAKRENNNILYAGLLSTSALLADMGARDRPTGFQEWAMPSSPLAQNPDIAISMLKSRDIEKHLKESGIL
jgi:ankyrin repeat protein